MGGGGEPEDFGDNEKDHGEVSDLRYNIGMEKFYVTSPIYYANSEPHIGSAYATLSADIIARHYRLKLGKENVFSLVGTDEHGQKVAQEAKDKGVDPKAYVDALVPKFKDAWKNLNIAYDVFMRTTDKQHEEEVGKVLQKIYDGDFVYSGVYEGLYCVGCEKFLTEKDLVDGKCPLHPNKKPIFQKEKNYFFKLKQFQPKLIELFESNEVEILPENRKKEILNRIKEGLEDISISREGVTWGIPVPWDSSQTAYVWIEALFNYYTATRKEEKEKFWPADLHIVGKDILWFHTTIWCALLLAADLPLPKVVFGHGFLILGGQKISKSLGNVIAPGELISQYGVDGARYLLASATEFGGDRDIKDGEFDDKYQADLANGLGNLVARIEALAEKLNVAGEKEEPEINLEVALQIEKYNFCGALDYIWQWIRNLDKYINEQGPWKQNNNDATNTLKTVIVGSQGISSIRDVAVAIKPFMPNTAAEILKRFSADKIVKGESLFPRL